MGLLAFSSTVVCAALNFRGTLYALGDSVTRDPYKKAPSAPVLYFKPSNTWIDDGAPIVCPAGIVELRMGGTLGVVIGSKACRVAEGDALSHVAGYVVVNDVSIPHESYYRPAIKERCRDTFHPSGSVVAAQGIDPNRLGIRILINGQLRAENSTANLVRSVERLIADITEFMTLEGGDVLVVGEPDNAPLAKIGDRVRVEMDGIGSIENDIAGAS
jgi:5-oxopent-3-ene-1,2,5-tricarboxylate decarboxylase/2-hydroxyhepta-2,4-diene-1,7-dioate isomerase